MKTEVIMKRDFNGSIISQKSKTGFLSATDLVGIANKWRIQNDLEIFQLKNYFGKKETKEFMGELENEFGKIKINSTGKKSHTWVHPLLFIDLALNINPKFKVEMYKWLYDNLLKYRNDSGDSYKKMTGALYLQISNKSEFKDLIKDVAKQIQTACNIDNWETANEKQLDLRNKIHENIALLSDILPVKEAVRIGILKSIGGR